MDRITKAGRKLFRAYYSKEKIMTNQQFCVEHRFKKEALDSMIEFNAQKLKPASMNIPDEDTDVGAIPNRMCKAFICHICFLCMAAFCVSIRMIL